MATVRNEDGAIIGLDVGSVRIGVARSDGIARIATPVGAISNDNTVWKTLGEYCSAEHCVRLVVGLPRGLSGQETAQTRFARTFAETAQKRLGLPVVLQDEAVTSRQAEAELIARGKPYNKGDIDALAATYILEDYLTEHRGAI